MKMYKTEIKWAFIFILMTLLWMLLEKLSGLHSRYIDYHLYLTNLYAIPAIWIYVLALKDKKKNFHEGKISYLQSFISGLIITLIITLASPLTQWITTYVITPEYFPNVIKRSVELGNYKTTEEAQAYFNFNNYVIQGLIGAFGMGLVTSAIVSLFIRTRSTKK